MTDQKNIKFLSAEITSSRLDVVDSDAVDAWVAAIPPQRSRRLHSFANPESLIAFIIKQGPSAKVRPDMKVVLFYDWEKPAQRLHGTTAVLRNLVRIAGQAKAEQPAAQKQKASARL